MTGLTDHLDQLWRWRALLDQPAQSRVERDYVMRDTERRAAAVQERAQPAIESRDMEAHAHGIVAELVALRAYRSASIAPAEASVFLGIAEALVDRAEAVLTFSDQLRELAEVAEVLATPPLILSGAFPVLLAREQLERKLPPRPSTRPTLSRGGFGYTGSEWPYRPVLSRGG